jgi:hypothetical protein
MTSRDEYTSTITAAIDAAQAILQKAFGNDCFDLPSNKFTVEKYTLKGLSNAEMRIAFFRDYMSECLTESTYDLSQEIDAEEETAWRYSRSRPDSFSAGDLL